VNHLRVLDSPDGEPSAKLMRELKMGVSQHSLFLDLSTSERSVLAERRRRRKKKKHLNCVLGIVWVELGGHAGQEERVLCLKNGSSVVSDSSSDLPPSPPPPTVARQSISRTASTHSFSFTTTTFAF